MKDTEAQTAAAVAPATEKRPVFIHTVFFWLKEGVTDAQKAGFEQGMQQLGKVASIQQFFYGPPAQTPRDVVDNSYDYAWIVHFASKEDHDAYQVDAIHKKFIEDHQGLWERVQVYDSVVK